MKHGITTSNNFCDCPRKYYYIQARNYKEATQEKHINLKESIMEVMEVYDRKGYEAASAHISKVLPNAYDTIEWEQMLYLYHEYFKNQPLPLVTIRGQLGLNIEYDLPLFDDSATENDISYTGKIAKVSQVDGKPCVVIRRVVEENIGDKSDYWKNFAIDHEIISSVFALQKTAKITANSAIIEAFRIPNTQRFNWINRRTVPFSLDKFQEKVLENITSVYTTINTFFIRKQFFISEKMIENWKFDILNIERAIKNCKETQKEYAKLGRSELAWLKNPSNCTRGRVCSFLDYCMANMEDSDFL